MRFKYSLAYPIIIIISLVAAATLFIGYYLNLHTLQATIETREIDKSKAIHYEVKEKITNEIRGMQIYSRFLKNNSLLLDGLVLSKVLGDKNSLKTVMDSLYSHLSVLGLDFFLVADQQGNILYRPSAASDGGNVSTLWGMDEALLGKDCLAAGSGPLGWTILSLAPLSYGGQQYGILVLGISLTDDFAKKIAVATRNQISFCTAYQILASSWPPGERRHVNLARVTDSILGKKSIFFNDEQINLSSFYSPLEIVDEVVCLVINADTTSIADLLRQKKRHLLLSLLAVLLVTIVMGSGLTLAIVNPLKKLQNRSLGAIKEFTQEEITLSRWGNEIDTLSQAVELMLSAIKLHIQYLHQTQETLRHESNFLDNVFTSIQDGLCVMDLNLTIIRANPVLSRRFGQASLFGQKCYHIFYGTDAVCEDCPCLRTLQTGMAGFQSRPFLIEGIEKWIEIYAFPLRDQDTGEITGVIEYSRDVTETKATENALRQREEQLRQASKMEAVGRLAGGVANDFNNILTVILGECDLLLQDLPEQDPRRKEVTAVMEAARRASSLTQHLLAFSRKQVLQPRPLDLNAAVANMDRMLHRVLGEDIDLVTVLAPGLGTVKVDLNQLEQVILNLAANARDAMPQGGSLTIETANVDLDEAYAQEHAEVQAGPYVMLAVSDTGVGVDKAAMDQIFEPFFTTKGMGRGTGLGLSIVYGIVKQSQGHIWVYSEPGRGTTFKIYLPRYDQPPQKIAETSPLPVFPAGGTETILLVEDEETVRTVVCRLLEQAGYRILAAADPDEALRLSREHQGPIHLLFTDVVMPGSSGRELAGRILAQHPQLKVLFMSGYTENAIIHHGVLDPGISFINKPFKYETLINKVREVLDGPSPAETGNHLEGA